MSRVPSLVIYADNGLIGSFLLKTIRIDPFQERAEFNE